MHSVLIRTYIILGLLFLTPILRAGDNGQMVLDREERDLKDAYAIMYAKKRKGGTGLPDVIQRKIFSYNKRGYPVERFLAGHTGHVMAIIDSYTGADGVVRLKTHSADDFTQRTWNTETGVCENVTNHGGIEIFYHWRDVTYIGRDGKKRLVTRANDDLASGDFRLCIRHLEPPANHSSIPLNAFEIAFGVANVRNSQEDPCRMEQLSQEEEDILAKRKVRKKWDIFSFGKAALGLGVLGFAAWWLWKNGK